MSRIVEIERKTNETEIFVRLNVDGTGAARLVYPLGFMAHMLNTLTRHGLFDIEINAKGDLEVDQHHLVEDTGIVLGQCFAKALGDKRGIRRSGFCYFPMDECLTRAAVDLSGRPFLFFDGQISGSPLISARENGTLYEFQTGLIEDFWQGFVSAAGCNLHLEVIRGRDDHHKIEALFKAAARALRCACEFDERARDSIPSTKGSLPGFDAPGVLV
ncbi:MAG: imidazoleglycerol-phosphate dehydratase HisB [Treponema sp.]|jgi:imidazoleglycerol-phosphate dehydratase|nr:imidazoleglycerol-phosphate dehydratase HisB [Treponema sp.]